MATRFMKFNVPSAEFVGVGKVKNYRLAFTGYAEKWGGATSNSVPCEGSDLYGVVWSYDTDNAKNFTDPNGLYHSKFKHFFVTAIMADGKEIVCDAWGKKIDKPEGLPGIKYITLVIEGAREHNLPAEIVAEFEKMGQFIRLLE